MKKEKNQEFQKIQKSKILTPYFFDPLHYSYSDSPCSRAPACTEFGVPRSKGVRSRGQKAESNKIAPWGHNFDPSGLILTMTHNSDQGASDLKV